MEPAATSTTPGEPGEPARPQAGAASPPEPSGPASASPAASGRASAAASEPAEPVAPEPAAAQPVASEPVAPQPAASAASQPRLSKREGRSPRDMALSLIVLIVPIALLLIFYRVVLDGDKPLTVDPAPSIQQASKEFTVLAPAGLDQDWHVTAATFKHEKAGATLRIGYVDPDGDPVQLVESTTPADTLLPAEVGKDGKRTGTYRTDAGAWLVYSGRPGEVALVSTEANRTILIVGKSEQANLEKLAASLK
ncbi:hypothetical protein Asi03nite_39140 [Actinoplanes siamensis]|uniref:DUF4245 domain-containing protein n=1 Tax=Actinoplanes siamensis TaxID=1223317 RepID=A0A919N8Q6_9ACTN|nr:hypothetical protein Asi03nite_39140 [Actinoplanes siamensis]